MLNYKTQRRCSRGRLFPQLVLALRTNMVLSSLSFSLPRLYPLKFLHSPVIAPLPDVQNPYRYWLIYVWVIRASVMHAGYKVNFRRIGPAMCRVESLFFILPFWIHMQSRFAFFFYALVGLLAWHSFVPHFSASPVPLDFTLFFHSSSPIFWTCRGPTRCPTTEQVSLEQEFLSVSLPPS